MINSHNIPNKVAWVYYGEFVLPRKATEPVDEETDE